MDNNDIDKTIIYYRNRIDNAITEYMELYPNSDLYNNQNHFYHLLLFISDTVFNNMLNGKNSNVDYKNKELIEGLYNIYRILCLEYGREISIEGFSYFTGISSTFLLNSERDLYLNATKDKEMTLRSKLYDNKSPVAQAILVNHDFNYNTGQNQSVTINNNVISAADLPKLGSKD